MPKFIYQIFNLVLKKYELQENLRHKYLLYCCSIQMVLISINLHWASFCIEPMRPNPILGLAPRCGLIEGPNTESACFISGILGRAHCYMGVTKIFLLRSNCVGYPRSMNPAFGNPVIVLTHRARPVRSFI